MGDIWYINNGFWIVYVDNMQVAVDFASIPALKHVTTYYDARGGKKAKQFRFYQGEDLRPGACLLHYVSRMLQLDYYKVLGLTGVPGVPYEEVYGKVDYQLEMFQLYSQYRPERKKVKTRGRRKSGN